MYGWQDRKGYNFKELLKKKEYVTKTVCCLKNLIELTPTPPKKGLPTYDLSHCNMC